VGTTIFGGTGTPGELLRTLGFAGSPAVLHIFSFVPVLGGIINFFVAIWLLVAAIVAIRQALDFSTGRAVGTAIVGWIALVIVVAIATLISIAVAAALGL